MTEKRVGGYEFNQEINRIRRSSTAIAEAILKIIDTNPGPQTLNALLLRISAENTIITNAVNTVEKIGENEKTKRTT